MIEYRNGVFGEPEKFDEAFKKFLSLVQSGEVSALHVGDVAELEQRKNFAQRLDALEEKLSRLEQNLPIKSAILVIPDNDQILKFGQMVKRSYV